MVINMRLKEFGNKNYIVLSYLKENEIKYKDDYIILDTQNQIAKGTNISLQKINKIMKTLIENKLVEPVTHNGKYRVTELGNKVTKMMEQEV